jgi:hypothetical protein
MANKKKNTGMLKSNVKRRSVNATGRAAAGGGAPFNEQDIKRRLGNFTGAGEHARVGGRTSGIVGQKTTVVRTDNKKTKRSKAKD